MHGCTFQLDAEGRAAAQWGPLGVDDPVCGFWARERKFFAQSTSPQGLPSSEGNWNSLQTPFALEILWVSLFLFFLPLKLGGGKALQQ
jgi:hypothetical protein